jgi:signal transduction histidine kinase/CheY-like chemotaxis protein
MRKSLIDRLLLPAIVGLTTVLAALLLFQRLFTEQRAEIEAGTKAQALFVKNKLEAELNARILPLYRLAVRWEVLGLNDEDMESDAALATSGYRGYQAIEWVDPTFNVRWAVPRRDKPDLGVNPIVDPRRRAALDAAKESGRIVVTRPATVQEGGPGILVCEPIFEENTLRGFLLGVIGYEELFSSVLQEVGQKYWVAVYDGEEEIYNPGGSAASQAQRETQEANIEFRQLTWRTRVWPKPETLADARSSLPKFALLGGILMAGLLAFAVYMAEKAQLYAQEVAAGNKDLRKEIVEREKAEEALRQAHKMEAVGRLAGGVAHDFNNLLMVIRGHAALAHDSFTVDNSTRQRLNEILRSADRASSLTRQLLAFSRKQVLQPKVLNLNSLVAQAAELFSPTLGENITLSLDLDSNLGNIKADAAQIEQVIMNLVLNARDAMPNGGQLTIQTADTFLDESWIPRYPNIRSGPHVMLAVHDTGCGMDEETQAHIFEPFFTTKEIGKGTGLGLATVYGTIDQSGGCLTVSSKIGEGTTIQIYLPRVKETIEVADKPAALPKSPKGNETILVVDDDDAVRRMTITFLKLNGYSVLEARSAADAIQLMESDNRSIDLVLTDLSMPGMSGRELAEQLVKMRSGLMVLYMSAYTEDAAINSGIHTPGNAFIEKPFSPDELAYKVREVLGGKMASRDAKYLQHHA